MFLPARYGNPYLNLILNWTFLLEIAICAVGVVVFLRERELRRRLRGHHPTG